MAYHDIANILTRLKNRFTTPYWTEDDGNIDKLMQLYAEPLAEIADTEDDILTSHQLQNATGNSLDQWGNLLQLIRNASEADDLYRARLMTQILIYRRSATPQDMVSTCANVLGVTTDRVDFVDGTSPATFGLSVYTSDIYASWIFEHTRFECMTIGGVSDSTKGYNNIANDNPTGGVYDGLPLLAFANVIDCAKAAGTTMQMFAKGSFECMAIGGANDSTKGYNNIVNANPDGGKYSGLQIVNT